MARTSSCTNSGTPSQNWGLERSDPTFAGRVKSAFDAAIANGKYRGRYAATNPEEYWAEGAQSYFDVHQRYDPTDIDTKEQLRAYDPALFAILEEVFGGVVLPAVCPAPTFDAKARYRITNLGLGSALSLDGAHLAATGNTTGQRFELAMQQNGFFRLITDYQPTEALDIGSGHELVMRPRAFVSGQHWRVSPVENGVYRLTTMYLGEGQSLTPSEHGPVMAPSTDGALQEWKIELLP